MSLPVEEVDPAAGTYRLPDGVLRRLPYPYEPGSLRADADTITATYTLGVPLLPRAEAAPFWADWPPESHRPERGYNLDQRRSVDMDFCAICLEPWPCPTAAARTASPAIPPWQSRPGPGG